MLTNHIAKVGKSVTRREARVAWRSTWGGKKREIALGEKEHVFFEEDDARTSRGKKVGTGRSSRRSSVKRNSGSRVLVLGRGGMRAGVGGRKPQVEECDKRDECVEKGKNLEKRPPHQQKKKKPQQVCANQDMEALSGEKKMGFLHKKLSLNQRGGKR